MEYRKMGRTGLKVSALCLGTMQFGWTADENTSEQILNAAFQAGVNFIDTANVYSRWVEGNPGGIAETIIGKWLKKNAIPRHQVIIATKVRARMGDGVNDEGLSRYHIMQAVEDSLRRLGCDYIDLYQAHWFDALTPIEETLRAFDDLIRQGKVRYIGASNYPAWRLMESLWKADQYSLTRYDCFQPHYNLVHRIEFENELADICRTYGLGVIPYSPLAGGFLSGKYRRNEKLPESARASGVSQKHFSEKNWELLAKMEQMVAQKSGMSLSQLAIAWLLADSLITSPIIGPRSLTQLQDNLGALNITLSPEERQMLSNEGKN